MSRKDYILFAKAIQMATDSVELSVVHKDQLTSALVAIFKQDNPLFDGFRFLKACERHVLQA